MKHTIIVVIGIVLIAVAYFVGHNRGKDYCAKVRHQPPDYWNKLAQLDRSFLGNVASRPSALTSGTYILETMFPGAPTEVHTLKLAVSNGKLVMESQSVGSHFVLGGFAHNGTVVSFALHDMDEGPSREYVGLVDGDTIWGKVYVPPGSGWHADTPPAVGVWRLYPKH